MEIKTFHGFEDFCVEKFENTDEWYYGIYPTWMSNVEVAEECGKGREYAGSKLCFFNKTGRSYEQKEVASLKFGEEWSTEEEKDTKSGILVL